jgi:hypothetical protein
MKHTLFLQAPSSDGSATLGELVREMLTSWDMMTRRLRDGVEFFLVLRAHEA